MNATERIFISLQNAELIIEILGCSEEYKEIKKEAESKGINFNSIESVIAKFLVRFQLFYLQTEKYCLKGAMKKIKACLSNDVQKMVSELKKEYPEVCDDNKMREMLLEFQFETHQEEKLLRCLLAILDKAVGGKATYPDYKEAHLEHTEAQSPTLGYTLPKPAKDVINSLGNQALLEKHFNVSGPQFNGNHKNNGDWHVKRETYQGSKFESTKRTAENHETWTEEDIKDEGKTRVEVIVDQLSLKPENL